MIPGHVLRDIDNVISHDRKIGDEYFQEVSAIHPTVPGRFDRSFNMTRPAIASTASPVTTEIPHEPSVFFGPDGTPLTNSKDVAAGFKRRPDNVLRDIDNILKDGPSDLRDLMFQEVSAFDPAANRVTRSFNMDRDGFALLAMGFTGPKALGFKLAYIRRFNEMERALQVPLSPPQAAPPNTTALPAPAAPEDGLSADQRFMMMVLRENREALLQGLRDIDNVLEIGGSDLSSLMFQEVSAYDPVSPDPLINDMYLVGKTKVAAWRLPNRGPTT